jgi:hypothetical protein
LPQALLGLLALTTTFLEGLTEPDLKVGEASLHRLRIEGRRRGFASLRLRQ